MGKVSVRAAGVAGIIFVLCVAVPGFLAGQPPDPQDPASKYLTYFHDNRGAIIAATFLSTVGVFFVVFFLGGLLTSLRRLGASPLLLVASLGGILLTGALADVGGICTAVAAYRANQATHPDAETVRMLSDVASFCFTLIGLSLGSFLAATGLAMAGSRLYPAWLPWVAGIATVLEVIGSGGVFATSGAYAPGGALGLLFGLVPFAVFTLATGIVMVLRGDAMEATPAAPAAT